MDNQNSPDINPLNNGSASATAATPQPAVLETVVPTVTVPSAPNPVNVPTPVKKKIEPMPIILGIVATIVVIMALIFLLKPKSQDVAANFSTADSNGVRNFQEQVPDEVTRFANNGEESVLGFKYKYPAGWVMKDNSEGSQVLPNFTLSKDGYSLVFAPPVPASRPCIFSDNGSVGEATDQAILDFSKKLQPDSQIFQLKTAAGYTYRLGQEEPTNEGVIQYHVCAKNNYGKFETEFFTGMNLKQGKGGPEIYLEMPAVPGTESSTFIEALNIIRSVEPELAKGLNPTATPAVTVTPGIQPSQTPAPITTTTKEFSVNFEADNSATNSSLKVTYPQGLTFENPTDSSNFGKYLKLTNANLEFKFFDISSTEGNSINLPQYVKVGKSAFGDLYRVKLDDSLTNLNTEKKEPVWAYVLAENFSVTNSCNNELGGETVPAPCGAITLNSATRLEIPPFYISCNPIADVENSLKICDQLMQSIEIVKLPASN